MSQDLYPAGSKRCFACIQWDGRRSYEPKVQMIKTDAGADGLCRLKHATVKGSSHCDQYFPLR